MTDNQENQSSGLPEFNELLFATKLPTDFEFVSCSYEPMPYAVSLRNIKDATSVTRKGTSPSAALQRCIDAINDKHEEHNNEMNII